MRHEGCNVSRAASPNTRPPYLCPASFFMAAKEAERREEVSGPIAERSGGIKPCRYFFQIEGLYHSPVQEHCLLHSTHHASM